MMSSADFSNLSVLATHRLFNKFGPTEFAISDETASPLMSLEALYDHWKGQGAKKGIHPRHYPWRFRRNYYNEEVLMFRSGMLEVTSTQKKVEVSIFTAKTEVDTSYLALGFTINFQEGDVIFTAPKVVRHLAYIQNLQPIKDFLAIDDVLEGALSTALKGFWWRTYPDESTFLVLKILEVDLYRINVDDLPMPIQ